MDIVGLGRWNSASILRTIAWVLLSFATGCKGCDGKAAAASVDANDAAVVAPDGGMTAADVSVDMTDGATDAPDVRPDVPLDAGMAAAVVGDAPDGPVECVVAPGESIQKCIDSVSNHGGGSVLLRPGMHVLDRYLYIYSDNIELRGDSADTTKLVLANGAQASPILIGSPNPNPDHEAGKKPVRNIVVRDLFIDCNKAGQNGEHWSELSNFPYINVSGITVRYGENVTIRDVIVARAPSAGILVEKSTNGFVLDRVELRESEYDGFSCNKSYHGRVSNSRLIENVRAGITATCDCSDNIFEINLISRNGSGSVRAPGIFLADAHRNTFDQNTIEANTDSGIELRGADCNVSETGASLNRFMNNQVMRHLPPWARTRSCAVYLAPDHGGPGTGNVAVGTIYKDNDVNGVCNTNPRLYEDRDPVVR